MSEGFPPLKDTCFSLNSHLGIANLAIYYIVPVNWIAISEFLPTNDTSDIDSQKDGTSSGSKRVATIERQLLFALFDTESVVTTLKRYWGWRLKCVMTWWCGNEGWIEVCRPGVIGLLNGVFDWGSRTHRDKTWSCFNVRCSCCLWTLVTTLAKCTFIRVCWVRIGPLLVDDHCKYLSDVTSANCSTYNFDNLSVLVESVHAYR